MSWRILLMSLCLSLALFACGDDKTQFEKDIEKIQNFLTDNNLTATQHPSGIFYTIDTEGTGGSPSQFATVIVKYKGRLLDGFVFDETVGNKTAQFSLRGTVRGFSVAATLLKRGGKGTFYLPSGLGYGRVEQGNIPRNSVLIFEIELVDFIN
jgi:FKBP-type peptidyl-prolyl cis-trans isomerase FkpA